MKIIIFEKLYRHDQILSPLLFKLKCLIANGAGTPGYFAEQFGVLLERMLKAHRGISAEIAKLPPIRFSTRVEIYRRLHRAKDFIDSCYQQPIQLPQIARIAQFSRYHFFALVQNGLQRNAVSVFDSSPVGKSANPSNHDRPADHTSLLRSRF